MSNRMNCWEFKKCGKEKTGDCPAYPKGGRICYLVAGLCAQGKCRGHML